MQRGGTVIVPTRQRSHALRLAHAAAQLESRDGADHARLRTAEKYTSSTSGSAISNSAPGDSCA